MKKIVQLVAFASILIATTACSNKDDDSENQIEQEQSQRSEKFKEAKALLDASAKEGKREAYAPGKGVNFPVEDSVYVKSALAINLTKTNANVTLPLFKGIAPNGKEVFYIITEASDFEVAEQLGVNYAPKLVNAIGTGGDQAVTIDNNGHLNFKGSVDFTPKREVVAGDAPKYFPPKSLTPGGKADAEWSSIVVLPSKTVLNAQIVSNDTGNHDRLVSIDKAKMTVTLQILNGFRGGEEYFFHLVTDASDDVPATLEKGVSAPRLAKLPAFGKSLPSDKSALLGFSPNANGITDIATGEGQGFAYSIRNNGVDPINVFPYPPANTVSSSDKNNYSPLWDAHVSKWTEKAYEEGKVRQIKSFKDQKELIAQGYITSLEESGDVNPFTGLKPNRLIINCPVIAHPNRSRVK